jgi:hypothetical protein
MNATDILRHRIAPAALDRITALGFPKFLGSFAGVHSLPAGVRHLPVYLWIDLSEGDNAGCVSINTGCIAEILAAEAASDPAGRSVGVDEMAAAAKTIADVIEASALKTIRESSSDERSAFFATKH